MSVQVINAAHTIDADTETHYVFHQEIIASRYPQVHDFYEFVLVTSGCLRLTLCEKRLELSPGSLVLVRPGDIHTKEAVGSCAHINLAFPAETVKSLFDYLYDTKSYGALLALEYCPPVQTSPEELLSLQQKMERLSMLSPHEKADVKTGLRFLLAEVLKNHLIHAIRGAAQKSSVPPLPLWLKAALQELEHVENLSLGMDFLLQETEKSKEHICRTFRKFLHTTASAYINALRLNYVANMLTHSDSPILDLAYEAGFQSASYFYRLFSETFHMSPQKFAKGSRRGVQQ